MSEVDITPEGDFIPRGSPGAGKGDKRRPTPVSAEEYARRWEETFGNGKKAPYKRIIVGISGRGLFPDRPDPTEEVDRLWNQIFKEDSKWDTP